MVDSNRNGWVYSTEHGRMCPGCNQAIDACACGKPKGVVGDGNVRVGRETKGRKGKGVTVITGLPLDSKGLVQLAKKLKRHCGAGGTVKDGVIEIQGEHRDHLVEALITLGYTAKRSG
jgi:translation initiation factor 1